MSIFEDCLGPDWQKQLPSLQAKDGPQTLPFPARPMWVWAKKFGVLWGNKAY
jgi:hypothetical protein